MEEGRSAFEILTGKTTGKKLLGSPRLRWEENRSFKKWVQGIGLIWLRMGIIGEPL